MIAIVVFPERRQLGRRTNRWWLLIALAAGILFCGTLPRMAMAQATPVPSGPFRIAGTVVNAKAGNALTHCRVTIISARNRQSMQSLITGEDGRFEFHVPAGKYSLEGAKRGFVTASYNQHEQFSTAIVTGADVDTENLILRLPPNAVLSGRVLDEFSEPVRNAQVTVYREERQLGLSRTSVYRSATTDDQGQYEVTPLPEGTYFISAKASPWYAVHPALNADGSTNQNIQVDSSLDVAYSITYYGDASDPDDATPIPVRAGDRLEADIHLNPVPAVHLLVHVPQGGNFPVFLKPGFDGAEQVEAHDVQSISSGVYELSGLPAGRYTVRMPDGNGHNTEASDLNLSSSGDLDASSAKSASQLKVAVQIAGGGSLPAGLQLLLRDSRGKLNRARVDAKGEADFGDVMAGTYDILAQAATERFSVVRVASDTATISGHTMSVPPGTSLTIALSLVGGSVAVEGLAERDGKPAPGAMMVLLPKNSEADDDRVRCDESDLDGSFTFRNVIPGSYTVVAIEGWDLEWGKPAALGPYLKRGQPLEVGNRTTPIKLPDAVEVQTK
ncbi:MAG: carboxypeptidase regulatory-like domain-containing protein [Terriglobales bacterium]|jgi:carboxypeptidase family protein